MNQPLSALTLRSPPIAGLPGIGGRLEGRGRSQCPPMVRDAFLRNAPHHEAERGLQTGIREMPGRLPELCR